MIVSTNCKKKVSRVSQSCVKFCQSVKTVSKSYPQHSEACALYPPSTANRRLVLPLHHPSSSMAELEARRYPHLRVDVSTIPHSGRGVLATRRLQPGEVVCSVMAQLRMLDEDSKDADHPLSVDTGCFAHRQHLYGLLLFRREGHGSCSWQYNAVVTHSEWKGVRRLVVVKQVPGGFPWKQRRSVIRDSHGGRLFRCTLCTASAHSHAPFTGCRHSLYHHAASSIR